MADRLRGALVELPLVVERGWSEASAVSVASYPGGRRPTSTVTLAGGGAEGWGEHVGWTEAAHVRFREAIPALVPRGRWTVGEWAREMAGRTADPHERAALEAAAIDLALRQAETDLFGLVGVPPRPVRYVVSFERRADPVRETRRLLDAAPGIELKLDVDAAWPVAVWAGLAATGAVAILDWKGTGTVAEHERAHRMLPMALLEDPRPGEIPWSAGVRTRLAADAAVGRAADVGRLATKPAALNVKPARMGGVLEALDAVAAARAAGIVVYLGGMFEVAVGRAQLHALAALLAPDGPNDVAPIDTGAAPPPRPPRLVVGAGGVGFGAALV
jgi:L-alanine-DL-glutamate epimerase-like enolase superfamily enzyme